MTGHRASPVRITVTPHLRRRRDAIEISTYPAPTLSRAMLRGAHVTTSDNPRTSPAFDARVTLTEYRYRPMAICSACRARAPRYYGAQKAPGRREGIPEGARDSIATSLRPCRRVFLSREKEKERERERESSHSRCFIFAKASFFRSPPIPIISATRQRDPPTMKMSAI